MKILVVDDSEARVAMIKTMFAGLPDAKHIFVTAVDSADSARVELRGEYDLVVLDVLIPKKREGVPQALHSANLLNDICNPKKNFVRPRLIIGLTADIAELGVYQEEFSKNAAVVLRGSLTELDWVDVLAAHVASLLNVEQKVHSNTKDKVLITVHGIRTNGGWQNALSGEIRRFSRNFECIEIKYGFFDLLSFSVPLIRRIFINKYAKRLHQIIKDVEGREVHIVAHSFGTMITSKAIKLGITKKSLKTVILCGSPLSHSANVDHIIQASEVTLNDCGTHDLVLIAARLFVWGLGDAGRVGFVRENNDSFRNRYFIGGHGLYFKNYNELGGFSERFWLPRLALGEPVEPADYRTHYFGEDLLDLSVKLLTFLKYIVYTGLIVWVIRYCLLHLMK